MNTAMDINAVVATGELSDQDLESVSGGIIPLLCAIALGAAVVAFGAKVLKKINDNEAADSAAALAQ
jgi:lactobin A/cerein 7B family class IIb bacteriocin